MNGSGRMLLASSYREDDLRRAADARLRQAESTGGVESEVVSVARSWASMRIMLAAIRRLVPRFG